MQQHTAVCMDDATNQAYIQEALTDATKFNEERAQETLSIATGTDYVTPATGFGFS